MPNSTSLTRGGPLLLACIAAFGAGCADETGLVIEVTRDEATTSAGIDQLRFYIGTSAGSNIYVEDSDPLQMVELGEGRDLLTDPYKLLLRPADAPERDPDTGGHPSVMVAALGFEGGEQTAFGVLDGPKLFVDGKVLSWPLVLRGGGAFEVTPTDCLIFEGGVISSADDADCDGDLAPDDCDDNNPKIGPSAQELCENGVDDNCNGTVDEEVDADMDGFTNCEECDDSDRLINPEAQESCDGIDNDCDGTCDLVFDGDEDGYTVCGSKILEGGASCLAPDETQADCNDELPGVHPDADEICDGIDNNCNDVCDDGFDPDGDQYTSCGSHVGLCQGTDGTDVDCAPDNGDIHPGALERCNGVDDNCDGAGFPESSPCYATGTTGGGETVCAVGTRSCDDLEGGVGWGDCDVEAAVDDPESHAPAELCTAYGECDAADVPDPFACANEMAATLTVTCAVSVDKPLAPTLCPATYAAIPIGDAAGCFWRVVGGKVQRRWEVGLSAYEGPDTTPTGSGVVITSACSIWFQVIKATVAPPGHDGIVLWRGTNATEDQIILVNLLPEDDAICPETGMSCTGFPTGP